MICEKTGANVWLEEYGYGVRADAYKVDNHMIFHVAARSKIEKEGEVYHYRAIETKRWFDKQTDNEFNVVVCNHYEAFGYDGKVLWE